jgi:putative transposase
MKQVARNLTDCMDGLLKRTQYLILDRDLLYTRTFLQMIKDAGVNVVHLPARSPNLNSYAEYLGALAADARFSTRLRLRL